MNFELEPWEVPPGADAGNLSVPIEFGPVDWNGEMTMISARWLELAPGEALAFFRPHCDEINYVVTSERGFLYQRHKRINSKTLGERTRFALENCELHSARLFHCAGAGLLVAGTQVQWSGYQNFWLQEHPLRTPSGMETEPSHQVFGWLQTQWNDANSELCIAWEWSHKTEAERNVWLGTIVPRWKELHDLMRAASCVAELPKDERWIVNHFDTDIDSSELLGPLQPLRKLFQGRFWFKPLPESYPEFLREYFKLTARHVQVQGGEFSAHQKLEAQLFLRDWLQQHAPEHLNLLQ